MRKLALVLVLLLLAAPARADRLFTTGFETNNSIQTEWTTSTGSPTFVTSATVAPHSGTYSLQNSSSAAQEFLRRDMTASVTTGTRYFGGYIRYSSITTADAIQVLTESSGGVNSWELRISDISSNKRFRLRNVPTSANSDCSNNLAVDIWYRWEVRWVISDTVGEVELRTFTGDSTSADCTVQIGALNVDTLGTNWIRLYIGYDASQTETVYHDDVGINDTAGTFQNAWLGPRKIAFTEPTSDDTVTWVKTGANCSGTTNTDCVDDEPGLPDDLSGYNRTTTAQTDRFNLSTISGPDSDDDMILIDVVGRTGGASATGTNTASYSVWDDGGAKTSGTVGAICDINGWQTVTINGDAHIVADLGTKVVATVQSYDLGVTASSIAQGCNTTAIWANVEWIDLTPPVGGCSNFIALLGAGCK